MQSDLVKGALLFRGEGCQTFATDNKEYAIREWESKDACHLAEALSQMLRRHIVYTTYERVNGPRSLVVRRAEPIPLSVVADCSAEVVIRFHSVTGKELERADLFKVPGVKAMWLDMMEDCTRQVARVVRAYLGTNSSIRLRANYGSPPDGGSLLEMINPLECDFGTNDYEALRGLIGGQVI